MRSGGKHLALIAATAVACSTAPAQADLVATVERVKPSIVIVGTYTKLGSPQFSLRGTGFAVADGTLIATNAHVLPPTPAPGDETTLAVRTPGAGQQRIRRASIVKLDPAHDLAVLRVEGPPLTPMAIGDSESVREGQSVAFIGFPIGGALGFSAVTHRGIVSAVTPIAIPGANARGLDPKVIRSLQAGSFSVFQLDATAYPGNSGGPLFDPQSGEVIGIINMVFVKATKESALTQPSGITFAIPSRHLAVLVNESSGIAGDPATADSHRTTGAKSQSQIVR